MPDDNDFTAIFDQGDDAEVPQAEWVIREMYTGQIIDPGPITIVPIHHELVTTRHGTYAVHQNWLKPFNTLKHWRKE